MAHLFHLVRCNRHEELNAALAEDRTRGFVNVHCLCFLLMSIFCHSRLRSHTSLQARDNIGYTLTHLGTCAVLFTLPHHGYGVLLTYCFMRTNSGLARTSRVHQGD
jgi:hypothetical protein